MKFIGAEDIKNHKMFANMDWEELLKKNIKAPFIPKLKDEKDVSHLTNYPQSEEKYVEELDVNDDPFMKW